MVELYVELSLFVCCNLYMLYYIEGKQAVNGLGKRRCRHCGGGAPFEQKEAALLNTHTKEEHGLDMRKKSCVVCNMQHILSACLGDF